MKIFLNILFIIFWLNSFSQSDSVKNKFAVAISPMNFISPNEDGLFAQYNLNEKISFELGGGIYNLIKHPYATYNAYGFTIRSGIKRYTKRIRENVRFYHEILVFYRQMQYIDRHYYNDGEYSIYETTDDLSIGGTRVKIEKRGDEIKNVICVQWLGGRKYFIEKTQHFIFDCYWGIGIRVKLREISINEVESHLQPYTGTIPPFKEEINQVFFSLQSGIKIAFCF